MFPGNQILLETDGVQVRAKPDAARKVRMEVEADLHWLTRGPAFVERVFRSRYGSDPLVMKLLELYLEEAPSDSSIPHEDDAHEYEDWNDAAK